MEIINYKILRKEKILKKYNIKNLKLLEEIIIKINLKLLKNKQDLLKNTEKHLIYFGIKDSDFIKNIKINWKNRRKIIKTILFFSENNISPYKINKVIGREEGEEKIIRKDINEIVKEYNFEYSDYRNDFGEVKRVMTLEKNGKKDLYFLIKNYFHKIYFKRGFLEEEKLLSILFENLGIKKVNCLYEIIEIELKEEKYYDTKLVINFFCCILYNLNNFKLNQMKKIKLEKYKKEENVVKRILNKISEIEKINIQTELIEILTQKYISLIKSNVEKFKISKIKEEYKLEETIIEHNNSYFIEKKIVKIKGKNDFKKIKTKLLIDFPKENEKIILENYNYLLRKLEIVKKERIDLSKVYKNDGYDQILIISNFDLKLSVKNLSDKPIFFIENKRITNVKKKKAMLLKELIEVYDDMKYYQKIKKDRERG